MWRFIFVVFLLAGWNTPPFYAQDNDRQPLEKALQSARGQERVDILLRLSDSLKYKQQDKAYEYAEAALEESTEINYPKGIMNSALQLGIYERDQGRTRRAANYTEESIEAAQSLKDTAMLLKAYELMQTIYQVGNRPGKVEEYLNKYVSLYNEYNYRRTVIELSEKEQEILSKQEALQETNEALQASEEGRQQVLNALKISEEEKLRKEAELATLAMERAELKQQIAESELQAARNEIRLQQERYIRNLGFAVAGALLLVFFTGWQRYRYIQQKKLSAMEKQRAQRLEEIDQLKDQFLANTSHELRTPLNGIIGIAEALYEKGTKMSGEKLKDNLSVIVLAGKRLHNLVNDIMDFSRLKNAELELNCKPLDLRALTEVVLRINQPMLNEDRVQLHNNIDPDLPAVWADEDRLQQILHNLIGNAVKFTDEGTVTIDAKVKDDFVEIAVADTGIGIPKEKHNTIFQAFLQADGTTVRAYSGTGLGLSITRQLVDLHGGSIYLESEPGEGTTFFFTLPVSDQQPEALTEMAERTIHFIPGVPIEEEAPATADPKESKPGPAVGGNGQRLHLLIVDDEPINQHVLRNHLSEEYFQVTSAMNGEEALRAIESGQQFDLVLLDVMMPRMSGFEVCQQIRKKYLPSELPIIMVTAKNQVKDLVQGLNTGANDYLAKPFSRDEFLARIKTHLSLHHINKATGRFVPSAFLRSLGRENITEVQLGDQVERTVTVFFSDIRSYTRLAETMTPDENFRFVNSFNRRMGPIIQENRGFVNQYLGDAIMAIFQDSPADALKASVEMQLLLNEYNADRQRKNRLPIRSGIGFHTGSLIMGIIGDDKRMDAATISDAVNTAARIESLNKYYGTNILLSEESYLAIEERGSYHFRYLGQVQVKGKKVPVGIYECLDGDQPPVRTNKLETLSMFEEGVEYYFSKDFAKAAKNFERILNVNPDDATAQLFLNKTLNFMTSGVPEGWTGVEVMQVK